MIILCAICKLWNLNRRAAYMGTWDNGKPCPVCEDCKAAGAGRGNRQAPVALPWDEDSAVADARQAAEMAWQVHKRIAFSADDSVCVSDSPIYKASRTLLLASIRQAYGLSVLMAVRVYDTLIESGEPVSWSVEYVRSASRRSRTLHAAQCSCIPDSSDSPDVW